MEIWETKRNKEQAKELPIIIPLVVFHGQQKWKQPSSLVKMLNGYDELPEAVKVYVPNFEYLLYDLSIYSDEDIKGSAQTRIMLTLLRDILSKTGDPLHQSIYNALYYWLFSQTLLLLKRKKADRPYFTLALGFILRKELQA